MNGKNYNNKKGEIYIWKEGLYEYDSEELAIKFIYKE